MNDDQPAPDRRGEEVQLEILSRFWAMSPEQQDDTLALIDRIEAAELN